MFDPKIFDNIIFDTPKKRRLGWVWKKRRKRNKDGVLISILIGMEA